MKIKKKQTVFGSLRPVLLSVLFLAGASLAEAQLDQSQALKPEGAQVSVSGDTAPAAEDTLGLTNIEIKISSPQSGFVATKGFEVFIFARNVDSVILLLKNKNTGTILNLGDAEAVGSDKWKKVVPASNLKSGEYVLEAAAIQKNREYRADSISLTVKIAENPVTAPSTAPISGSGTDSEQQAMNASSQSLIKFIKPSAEEVISKSEIKIEINASNASVVEVLIREKNSTLEKYLGRAVRNTGDLWSYTVDLKKYVPNGDYYLVAKMKDLSGSLKHNSIPIKVSFLESFPVSKNTSSDLSAPMTAAPVGNEDMEKNAPSPAPSDAQNREVDSDGDGLSDYDEIRIGTDQNNPDTDRDGFLDGDEFKNGFDPLKFSSGDKSDRMVFENPKESAKINADYRIEEVLLEISEAQKKVLKIKGKGLPNSFVTIYIFSDPIVVTVKTDANGDWVYELDKDLEDGEHEAYVAVTDNTGKITGRSEPLRFIKTAEAATVIAGAQDKEAELNQSPAQKSRNAFVVFAFVAVAVFLGISLAVVGVINHKHIYDK